MTHPLRVSSDFPGGNACFLETRSGGETPEIVFMPSPAGGPEAMWFRFRIQPPVPPPRHVRCVLHLPENLLGGGKFEQGFLPVFRTERGDWERVGRVEPRELPDGRRQAAWLVPGDQGAAETALCYPYGQEELDALAGDLAPAFSRNVIGATWSDRPLERLANAPGVCGSDRPGVYCLARQHAGETPGSWALDGFLRAMADAGESAPLVWAVPFVDPDGVAWGRYGKDRFPWDFNRSWGSKQYPEELRPETGTHPMRYEVRCIQNDMARWRERCQPRIVLDFHAPGMSESEGIYCFLRELDAQGRPDERHRPWVESFERALGAELASGRFVRSGKYPSRWDTARVGDYAIKALGVPQATFEVPYAVSKGQPLTRDTYRLAGRRMAEGVVGVLAGG